MIRVYLFKIDCTYNKPRAEGDERNRSKSRQVSQHKEISYVSNDDYCCEGR